MSVRFLGRRVHLALAVVLVSAARVESAPMARLSGMLAVPMRTLSRWRQWWCAQFPLTPLWRSECARFMPPVAHERLPACVLERFVGATQDRLMRMLVFLTPLTVRASITIPQGR